MIRNSRIKAAIAAVTILGATGAALLVPASPAVAFSSGGLVLDVAIQSPAHLLANGAAIAQPVQYTCFGTNNAQVEVSVTERVSGGAIATGNGILSNPVCTGEIQTTKIDIVASGARAFTKGSAFATASIFGCANFCGNETDNRTIAIQR
ncbi:MAG TPA: hypothetical protein VGL06_07615 [Pseudonocardiaceae bacterium]